VKVTDIPIFSTPILFSKFAKHGTHEFPSIEKVDRKPFGWIMPLNTSFPGIEEHDPYISKELLQQVRDDVLEHCVEVMKECNMPHDISFKHFWYNSYYEGQGQEIHNHLGRNNVNPFWSGIYLCQNCYPGQLQFTKMDNSMRTQSRFPYNDSMIASYYQDMFHVRVKDGYILLFPPHLNHHVKIGVENRHKMRLTFSFNIKINERTHLTDEYFRDEWTSD
jgi:hypothetical protein